MGKPRLQQAQSTVTACRQYAYLADAGVTNEEELEEIVVLAGMHGYRVGEAKFRRRAGRCREGGG